MAEEKAAERRVQEKREFLEIPKALIKVTQQRDEAIIKRDEAILERDNAIIDRDDALKERDDVLRERDDARDEITVL